MSTSHHLIFPMTERRPKTLEEILANRARHPASVNPLGAGGSPGGTVPPDVPPITLPDLVIPAGASMAKSGNNYLFIQLPYQGQTLEAVEFGGSLYDNGNKKTYANWKIFQNSDPEHRSVADAEIVYQSILRAFQLKDDAGHKSVAEDFIAYMQSKFQPGIYYSTLTTPTYQPNSLDAVLHKEESLVKGIADKTIKIPEFAKYDDNWSYLILSAERPETKLAEVKSIPSNAKPVLEMLLGSGYEHCGAVFSYFSSRKGQNLRESRLWTPTETNRALGQRLVSFDFSVERFRLNADDNVNDARSAFWVRRGRRASGAS